MANFEDDAATIRHDCLLTSAYVEVDEIYTSALPGLADPLTVDPV